MKAHVYISIDSIFANFFLLLLSTIISALFSGETYECDRSDDRGFRCISEQVSHHPPMVAQYSESTTGLWQCWQEFSMRSKFKGKYLEVEPLGIAHLEFPKSGNHYTWRKVKTVVHNIVIGKLWVDQHGEMSVINHKTGDKCHMKFEPYSYFGGAAKKVTGTVVNSNDKVVLSLYLLHANILRQFGF